MDDHSTNHDNFNPRSHGGSDTDEIVSKKLVNNFNPRSHGGSDCTAE